MHTHREVVSFKAASVPQCTWSCLHSRNEIIHEAPGVTFPQEEGERKTWMRGAAAFSDSEGEGVVGFFIWLMRAEGGRVRVWRVKCENR